MSRTASHAFAAESHVAAEEKDVVTGELDLHPTVGVIRPVPEGAHRHVVVVDGSAGRIDVATAERALHLLDPVGLDRRVGVDAADDLARGGVEAGVAGRRDALLGVLVDEANCASGNAAIIASTTSGVASVDLLSTTMISAAGTVCSIAAIRQCRMSTPRCTRESRWTQKARSWHDLIGPDRLAEVIRSALFGGGGRAD